MIHNEENREIQPLQVNAEFISTKKKMGNSYGVLIPIQLAKLLDEGREYKFIITEKKKEADTHEDTKQTDR